MLSNPALRIPLIVLGGALVALSIVRAAVRRAAGGSGRRSARSPFRRPPRRHSRGRRSGGFRLAHVSLSAFVVVLLLIGVEAARAVPSARDLQLGAADLRLAAATLGTQPSGWTDDRIAAAARLQSSAKIRLARSAQAVHDDTVVRLSLHVPWAATQASAVLTLARTSSAAAAAMGDLIQVARAYRLANSAGGSTGERALALLQASATPMGDASQKLTPALADLQSSLRPGLIGSLRTQVQKAVTLLTPLNDTAGALAGAGAAADALGAGGPRTYLVLLQNPAEIRPAGGFAGAVGVVTLNRGNPSQFLLRGQETLNPLLKGKFPVPYPLSRYLKFYKNNLEIGDAGWDPDFPTSAALAEHMYLSATNVKVDGTVAVDPYAISALLNVTGPVDVPGYGRFDSTNFFPQLDYIVNVSTAPNAGKGALAPIAQVVLQRVINSPVSDWPRLLKVFRGQAAERHLIMALDDPQAARSAAQAGYDGAIQGGSSDYLMINDANVGATKGDYFVRKSASLKVDVASNGMARHELTLSYDMPPVADATDKALNPGDGSYRDYLRIYLPETANIAHISWTTDGGAAEGGVDDVGSEHGKKYVALYFRLPRGQRGSLSLSYEVPLDPSAPLTLLVQKQAGVSGLDFRLLLQDGGRRRSVHANIEHDYLASL